MKWRNGGRSGCAYRTNTSLGLQSVQSVAVSVDGVGHGLDALAAVVVMSRLDSCAH
jgi:hypothetical protein